MEILFCILCERERESKSEVLVIIELIMCGYLYSKIY